MVKNKIISTIGIMFCLLSVNSYGAAQNIVKPKINSIGFWSGKWHINYDELKNGTNLLKEELFIDGSSDRIVTIGTKEKRGFSLNGTYDVNSCHKAYVVVYDKTHKVVTTSDTFSFGKISKCTDYVEPADTVSPVITLVGVNPQVVTKGQSYTELGATALDNRDGELTNKIVIDSSDIDTSTVGDYTVTYDVIDASGNDAITVTRIVKVVSEDFSGELEIHSMNFFKGKWHIRYQDLRKVKGLKKEILFVDGAEVRTVTGGYNRSHDRGFSFEGDYADACHEAYIVAYDSDDNNLSQSDVFEFGNVIKCGGDKTLVPEAPQNLQNTFTNKFGHSSIVFEDKSRNELGFHIYDDGILVQTIEAHKGVGSIIIDFGLFRNYDDGGILNIVVKAFNDAGESAESNRVLKVIGLERGTPSLSKTGKSGLYSLMSRYGEGSNTGDDVRFFYLKDGKITFISLGANSYDSHGYGISEGFSFTEDRAFFSSYSNLKEYSGIEITTWDNKVYNISDLSNIFEINGTSKSCSWTTEEGPLAYKDMLVSYSERLEGSDSWTTLYDKSVEDKEYSCDHKFKDVNLTKGLVAHYEFENNVTDSSGNGNDGTAHGGVSYASGVIGQAGSFDGVDDYVEVESKVLNSLTNNMSVSLFIKTDRSRFNDYSWYQGILAKGNNPRTFSLYTEFADNKNFIHVSSTITESYNLNNTKSQNEINLNSWNHVVVQLMIKNNKKYVQYVINGVIEEEKFYSNQTHFIQDAYNLLIGKTYEANRSFKGLIDDLRIYNRALSEAEIAELYKMGESQDSDADGISDKRELELGLNPNSNDSDNDGILDLVEVGDINNPTDTDADGIIDALDEDSDDDGFTDKEEVEAGTDPKDPLSYPGSCDMSTAITKEALKLMIANAEDVTEVNTCAITDMSYLFENKKEFNQDISGWDVSHVTNMKLMFFEVKAFNQAIGDWNVSSVTNMNHMFGAIGLLGEAAFNQSLEKWDVSNVTDMSAMFANSAFNQPIGNWDVSNVTDMSSMFANNSNYTSPFNQPIGEWNTSSVINMSGMFYRSRHFNQNIKKWDVTNVISSGSFAYNSVLEDVNNPFVTELNKIPTVNVGDDKTVPVNTVITIIGTATDDGLIVAYEWKEGSDVLATTASFDYTPTTLGEHNLTLTVTDDDGAVGSDEVVIKALSTVTTPLVDIYMCSFYKGIYGANFNKINEPINIINTKVDSCAFDSQGNIYWASRYTHGIFKSDAEGNNIRQIVSGLTIPIGLAIDEKRGRIYWADWLQEPVQSGNIAYASLEGHDKKNIVTEGLRSGGHILIDPINDKLYISDIFGGQILRTDMEGKNIEHIANSDQAEQLVIDYKNNNLIWADVGKDTISSVNLTDFTQKDIIIFDDIFANPSAVGIDKKRDKILFIIKDKLQSVDLDGENLEILNASMPFWADSLWIVK